MATAISEFVPKETKDTWKDKIPMGCVGPSKACETQALTPDAVVRVKRTNSRGLICILRLMRQAIRQVQTFALMVDIAVSVSQYPTVFAE